MTQSCNSPAVRSRGFKSGRRSIVHCSRMPVVVTVGLDAKPLLDPEGEVEQINSHLPLRRSGITGRLSKRQESYPPTGSTASQTI